MATTAEILKAAEEVGKLIATHDAARKFEASVKKLQADVEAQRILADFNRTLAKLGEKEANGQPIEVAEKRDLEQKQNLLIRNAVLREFQMAQMDYLDLMRKVDDALGGAPGGPATGAPVGAAGPVMGQ